MKVETNSVLSWKPKSDNLSALTSPLFNFSSCIAAWKKDCLFPTQCPTKKGNFSEVSSSTRHTLRLWLVLPINAQLFTFLRVWSISAAFIHHQSCVLLQSIDWCAKYHKMEIEFRIAFLVSSKVELCLTLEMLRIFTRLKRAQGFQNFLRRQNSVLFFFKSVYWLERCYPGFSPWCCCRISYALSAWVCVTKGTSSLRGR